MLARSLLAGLIALLSLTGLLRAEPVVFNAANYAGLASADSSGTIKPGTTITRQNWQTYRRYLPYGIQILYAGNYTWRVGDGPEFAITVGPTISYKWPRQYLEDTEKYDQARLQKLDGGGFRVTHYIAGLPFPIPDEPDLAAKAIYNWRYAPVPSISRSKVAIFVINQFLNSRRVDTNILAYRLSHLSTPGITANPPYGKDYLMSTRFELATPGDTIYQVALTLQPDDASQPYEQYVFLPALRRPLTISTFAPCTYMQAEQGMGGDAIQEDTYMRAGVYAYTLAGNRKLLFLTHPRSDSSDYGVDSVNLRNSTLPGWPKPALGNWELRDVFIIDARPLPKIGPDCFGHRLFYIDKDSWTVRLTEDYDVDGNLWRIVIPYWTETPDNNGDGDYMVSRNNVILNMRENHVTVNMATAPVEIDKEVPAQYRDAASDAFPSSLHTIVR